MDSDLKKILVNLQNAYGEDFFHKMVVSFSSVLHVDYVFITKIDLISRISSIIAISANGEIVDNFNYDLDDTPCSNVATDSVCCYPMDVTTLFPKDQLLKDMGIEGYIGSPLHDSNGKLIGLSAVLSTKPIKNQEKIITLFEVFSGRIAAEMERIEQSAKLVESEMRLQLAISGSNEGLWDWNLQTNEVYYSPHWFEMLGYQANEFPSTLDTWKELVHPQDQERTLQRISDYIQGHLDSLDVKFRMKHQDGHWVNILSRAKFALDKRGNHIKPLRLVGTHVDISQIKKLKEEFEIIFNTSKDAIAVLDLESKFIKVNKAYSDVSGYTEKELLKKTCIEMSIPEDVPRAMEALAKVLEHGFVENFEKGCFKKDGSIFTINMSIALMPDQKHLLITTKDVTLEKKHRLEMEQNILKLELAQKELQEAKAKEEQAHKSKSQFLANMSHEIRTPMTGIIGFVDQLAKSEKDSQRLEKFNVIKDSTNQLLSIINDILDFSKIESGKLDIDHHPYKPNKILENTVDIFSQLASKKNITLEVLIDENIPEELLGDETRIKQVVFNLVSNAIKFTSKSGKIIINASYNPHMNIIRLSIKDDGIGIAQNKLITIFEAFSQEDTSITRKFGGTGLGLSISSKLIQLMGGELKVKSTLGKGSEFHFELPAEIYEKNISLKENILEVSHEKEALSFNGHALIVEDNKTNQMLMSLILEDLGLTFDIASDGVEAIEKFKKHTYQMIMMDENMPNMNGIEATKHIRELENVNKESHTPVIAVTANALKEDRVRFLDAGMDEYISKPYDEEDIIRVLTHYLV